MPAYRSDAEAEIREQVVRRLRLLLPGARIIHEVNCSSFGPNRLDVLAVSTTTIAAIEIKSAKDKLDRLPAQLSAMRGCATYAIPALHRKFFEVKETPRAGVWISAPKEAGHGVVWGFDLPDANGVEQYRCHLLTSRWDKPKQCLPAGAIDLLWRSELREIASRNGLSKATSRLTMPELVDVIQWAMTGQQIAREICAALRSRICVEADDATPNPFAQIDTDAMEVPNDPV